MYLYLIQYELVNKDISHPTSFELLKREGMLTSWYIYFLGYSLLIIRFALSLVDDQRVHSMLTWLGEWSLNWGKFTNLGDNFWGSIIPISPGMNLHTLHRVQPQFLFNIRIKITCSWFYATRFQICKCNDDPGFRSAYIPENRFDQGKPTYDQIDMVKEH